MTTYHEKQRDLMKRWREKEYHKGKEFIEDGIIDFPRWQKAKRKVMFLLKEAYGGAGDLCQIIRDDWKGPKYKVWWSASYWLYAINKVQSCHIPVFPKKGEEVEECVEMLLSSAIVNLKKSDGKSYSKPDELKEYTLEDLSLLREQIELISPDLIVVGNTFEYLEILFPDSIKPVGASGLVWQEKDKKIINYWHPANQYPNQLCFYALCAILQESQVF